MGALTSDQIARLIADAKIGGERRAAQKDTCVAFGIALLSVLRELGVAAFPETAHFQQMGVFHAVVRVDEHRYDSRGLFSVDVLRGRSREMKHLPDDAIRFQADDWRGDIDEADNPGLVEFLTTALRASSVARLMD